ncbi:hypothetical protein ACFQ1E_08715 [Sphingomonas canadensis]|uniref:Uncharacterized protein n=1 Tax=Sphingomonas canadensis TaxID=1219257 RepID=A0ABW3H9S0_9SPHN
MPFVTDREQFAAAARLMRDYGAEAGLEAAARADHSRDQGNHIHFCRWRQIERLIVLLSMPCAVGTVH